MIFIATPRWLAKTAARTNAETKKFILPAALGTFVYTPIRVMTDALHIRIAAVAGFLAVALGAFGAHGLKEILAQNGTTAIWEKAVFYHFIHAVMLFVVAGRKPFVAGAWW